MDYTFLTIRELQKKKDQLQIELKRATGRSLIRRSSYYYLNNQELIDTLRTQIWHIDSLLEAKRLENFRVNQPLPVNRQSFSENMAQFNKGRNSPELNDKD